MVSASRQAAGLRLVTAVLLGFIVLASAQTQPGFNITAILDGFPNFSLLNQLLSKTGVADEINSRQSLTLLAPSNDVLGGFESTLSQADVVAVADLARFHVLLQYFDMEELKALPFDNYTSVTTLLQSTGRADGHNGFVNIYNSASSILIGNSAQDPSSPNATVITSVTQIPSSISVIQIDRVLTPVGFSTGGANIIKSLQAALDFTQFINLLNETGVASIFEGRQSQGITVFAPKDSAFNAITDGSLQRLTTDQKKLLAEYHGLTSYDTLANLETLVDSPLQTIASTIQGGYVLNATSAGSVVSLLTGVDNATLISTVFDARPVSIFAIDAVLMPKELFGADAATSPAGAPGPSASALKGKAAPGPHIQGSTGTSTQLNGVISLALLVGTAAFAWM